MRSEVLLTKEILISQTGDLKEACQSFITELDLLYSKYMKKMEALEQEWKVEFNNGNFDNAYFYPEKLSIKSPLTIINAPWGTGKTHFIETLAKFFIKKTIDTKQFKNIVIVDAWQHVNSDNVPNDIVRKLASVLIKFLDFSKRSKVLNSEILNNVFGWLSNKKCMSLFVFLYQIVSFLFPKWDQPEWIKKIFVDKHFPNNQINNQDKQNYEELLSEIDSNLKPTLIIFDNIERMGYHAIEIIKTIQQLSILKKFVFVISMNKNQLTFGHKNDLVSGEAAIDKYISLGIFFTLRWNYVCWLKSFGCPEEYCEIIDNILKTETLSTNQRLSIRTLENCLNNFSLIEAFKENKYKGLSVLKQIWNSDKIRQLIDNDIRYFFKINDKINKKYNENIPCDKLLWLENVIYIMRSINSNSRNMNLDDILNFPYQKNQNHIFFENIVNAWTDYYNKLKLCFPKFLEAIRDTKTFIEKEKTKSYWGYSIGDFYSSTSDVNLIENIKMVIKGILRFVNNSTDYLYETYNVNSTIVDLARNFVNDNEKVTEGKLMQKLRQMYPNL